MKKLLIIVFMLSFISYGQQNSDYLLLYGNIIPNDENVAVNIYYTYPEDEKLDDWIWLQTGSVKGDFTVTLNVGFIYSVSFVKSDGETRTLIAGVTESGSLGYTVDYINSDEELGYIYRDPGLEKYVKEIYRKRKRKEIKDKF